jgi:hypothetical protein
VPEPLSWVSVGASPFAPGWSGRTGSGTASSVRASSGFSVSAVGSAGGAAGSASATTACHLSGRRRPRRRAGLLQESERFCRGRATHSGGLRQLSRRRPGPCRQGGPQGARRGRVGRGRGEGRGGGPGGRRGRRGGRVDLAPQVMTGHWGVHGRPFTEMSGTRRCRRVLSPKHPLDLHSEPRAVHSSPRRAASLWAAGVSNLSWSAIFANPLSAKQPTAATPATGACEHSVSNGAYAPSSSRTWRRSSPYTHAGQAGQRRTGRRRAFRLTPGVRITPVASRSFGGVAAFSLRVAARRGRVTGWS